MSSDTPNPNNTTNNSSSYNQKPPSPSPADMQHNRRGSVTSAALANLFQRSNSTAGTPVFPGAITSAAINEQRRRLSVSTTSLGLSGTSPTGNPAFNRRASLSTNNSDSVDENAVEEEDYSSASRTVPVSPFTRRMSFGASAAMRRPGCSPGTGNGRPNTQSPGDASSPSMQRRGTVTGLLPPSDSAAASATSWKSQSSTAPQAKPSNTDNPSNPTRPRALSDLFSATPKDQGFNWSEQLRSRAESTVASGQRPSFSFASGMTGSPPRTGAVAPPSTHDRNRSVSEMPAPPAQAPKPRSPPRDNRPKPDAFQERILKGDFYMD
ncbi:hypothetical protein DHEL01_v201848 [Diaporthe helianthi]|uniref:Uncharacterized protein n=1 Tax=Diaporthe helianthi TaxID=158607 RepID=A0A2P5IB69_DIAHE|nr:hypothetical protein DHEL01_v201848 [Diaporthe helianthi]